MIHSLHDPIVNIILSKNSDYHGYEALLHVTGTRCEALVNEYGNRWPPDGDARPFFIVYRQSIPDNFYCPLKPRGGYVPVARYERSLQAVLRCLPPPFLSPLPFALFCGINRAGTVADSVGIRNSMLRWS